MQYLKEILKGVFIGVANIIPGVSGGTMALSMGIYEKIIFSINNIRKDFKGSFKTLLPYVIGVAVGIILLSFVIKFLLNNYELPTLMAFIGLILGGLDPIVQRVENEKFKITHFISFLLFATIIVIPTIISGNIMNESSITLSFFSIILMIILGIISAASMVVPGVSGSMILMMIGYYNFIIDNITIFINSALHFNTSNFLASFEILFPFGIGVLLGIVITSKIIEKLLRTYPNATMWGIIALVVVSPFAILYGVNINVSILTIIISIFTFLIRIYCCKKIIKIGEKENGEYRE